jgi:glycopeptide antibiotics resistance protein
MDQVITISKQLIVCMVGFVLASAIVELIDKEGKLNNLKKFLKIVILFACVGIILYETILFRPVTPEAQYELIPFWSYRLAWKGETFYFSEILLNYLLYVPFGFMLKAVFWRLKWWQCILICLFSSAAIEVSQLVFHIGLFEWDDMIGNTLGGFVGYVCHRGMNRVVKMKPFFRSSFLDGMRH